MGNLQIPHQVFEVGGREEDWRWRFSVNLKQLITDLVTEANTELKAAQDSLLVRRRKRREKSPRDKSSSSSESKHKKKKTKGGRAKAKSAARPRRTRRVAARQSAADVSLRRTG